jgi:hypothetical protein
LNIGSGEDGVATGFTVGEEGETGTTGSAILWILPFNFERKPPEEPTLAELPADPILDTLLALLRLASGEMYESVGW